MDLIIGNGNPVYEISPLAPPFLMVGTESTERLHRKAKLI
jgi:hypothetical protein